MTIASTVLNDAQSMLQEMQRMANIASDVGQSKSKADDGKFQEVLVQAVSQVNDLQQHAAMLQNSYELHDPNVSLAKVMVESQKANLAFQAMVQIRNKAIQAYKDIANMQI